MKHFTAILLGLVLTSTIYAQDFRENKIVTVLETFNGNTILGLLQDKSFAIETKYGKINPIFQELTLINYGSHCEKHIKEKIDRAFINLGSTAHKNRELAHKDLFDLYRFSYFPLKDFSSKDIEVSRRVEKLIKDIEIDKDMSLMPNIIEDIIYTIDGQKIKGRILDEELNILTDDFGPLKIHLSKIKLLRNTNIIRASLDLTIDTSYNKWVDTGLDINGKFKLYAFGKLDMWPLRPGEYVCTPNGLAHFQGNFPAGSIVAKIGETGFDFLVGESFSYTGATVGRLYLKINTSGWDDVPTGKYSVRIK